MREWAFLLAAAAATVPVGDALASAAGDFARAPAVAQQGRELPPYLECVPFARERSGVQIYGDALTWWDQAAGRYKRGRQPRPGAVMAFRPHGNMTLGHVAAVARVIDSRTVLLDHANWSPIDGRRGQIERGVRAIDVSPANDWSQVRVWYDPLQDLGTTAWPVSGFIYNERDGTGMPLGGMTRTAALPAMPATPLVSAKPSRAFSAAFANMGEPVRAAARPVRPGPAPAVKPAPAPRPRDPIAVALARYGS